MTEVSPVYVVSAVRTPIAKAPGGGYKKVHPAMLGATVINESLNKAAVLPKAVDEVVFGCVTQTGPQGFNLTRTSVLKSILGHEVPASTVNIACGSGTQAITNGAYAIASGNADIVIVGGVENLDMVSMGADMLPTLPTLKSPLEYARTIKQNAKLIRTYGPKVNKFTLPEGYEFYDMGRSGDALAKEQGISRQEIDRLSARSQWNATVAQRTGRFDNEIVFVETPYGTVKRDEGIRPDTTLTGLAKLQPSFAKKVPKWGIPYWPFTGFGTRVGGYHTAGTSSQVSAGAAALVLASEEAVNKYGLQPLAQFIGSAKVGTNPFIAGQQLIGPGTAIKKVLAKVNLTPNEVDLYEINEAFAAVVIAAMKELGLPEEKVNVNGGAIALGHPLGCSGARLAVTLIHEMLKRHKEGRPAERGVVSLCIGGGQAIAALFKRYEAPEEAGTVIEAGEEKVRQPVWYYND